MSTCDISVDSGSSGRPNKNAQAQTKGDCEKQRDLCKRPARTDKAADIYKQMLMDTWSAEEEKVMNRSVSKVSNHGLTSGQTYELLVRAKNEEQPIVGYTPVFAQMSTLCKSSQRQESPAERTMEKPDHHQTKPSMTRERSFTNKSELLLETFIHELKEESYVTPFDKFVPHENQLPELDPSEEAKLLAGSEIDPVRGVFEQNLEKEIADYETLLNLPSFEQFANRSDNVRRKMRENMKFWHTISQHEKPKPPTDQDLKLLDYATLCNMYTGTWGMDEDSMMLQFFYKFQYDDKWRERIKKGCFNMLDECNPQSCGICKEVTDEEVARMKPECFFEIEDKNDYENVVLKIKEEFNKKYDDDTNWDFKQLIMNPLDSDLDSDSFVSDDELQMCVDERPSSKDWIRAKGTWISPKGFDVPPKDEEDLLPQDMKCEDIEFLRYRNIVPQKPGDQVALEAATLELMRAKYEKKKADERKGYFWRAKSNYLYRWPDFRKKTKKN